MSIDFRSLHGARKHFIHLNEEKDNVVITGSNTVLISAPHGVLWVRLGRYKLREIGSLAPALSYKKAREVI